MKWGSQGTRSNLRVMGEGQRARKQAGEHALEGCDLKCCVWPERILGERRRTEQLLHLQSLPEQPLQQEQPLHSPMVNV